jgi:hypothetical protein
MTYLIVFAVGFIVGGLALMADIQRTEGKKLEQIRRIKKKLEESGDICHAMVYVKDNQLQVDMREEALNEKD